jgi:hypothetical protein
MSAGFKPLAPKRHTAMLSLLATFCFVSLNAQAPSTVTVLVAIWDDVRAADTRKPHPVGALITEVGDLDVSAGKRESINFGREVVKYRGTAKVPVQLEPGRRYTLRVRPKGGGDDVVTIPLAVPSTMCPNGCDRDTIHVEFYPNRVEAWGRAVVISDPDALTLVIKRR